MKESRLKKSQSSAQKNTSLPGNYWVIAAKQIEWQVDHDEKHISVPHNEIDNAKDNLMVQHFINNGYHIQAAIEGIKNSVFNPDIRLKLPSVKIQPNDAMYHTNDRFLVKSSDCELIVKICESKKIHLSYLNRPHKHDIIVSEELITQNINRGLWKLL